MGRRIKLLALGGAVLVVASVGVPLLIWGGDAGKGELLVDGRGVALDSKLISTGEQVEIQDYLRPGVTTLIEFTGDWLPACRQAAARFEDLSRKHRFRLRTIDIGEWDSPVAKQYGIQTLPAAWLFRGHDLIEDDYKEIVFQYCR